MSLRLRIYDCLSHARTARFTPSFSFFVWCWKITIWSKGRSCKPRSTFRIHSMWPKKRAGEASSRILKWCFCLFRLTFERKRIFHDFSFHISTYSHHLPSYGNFSPTFHLSLYMLPHSKRELMFLCRGFARKKYYFNADALNSFISLPRISSNYVIDMRRFFILFFSSLHELGSCTTMTVWGDCTFHCNIKALPLKYSKHPRRLKGSHLNKSFPLPKYPFVTRTTENVFQCIYDNHYLHVFHWSFQHIVANYCY